MADQGKWYGLVLKSLANKEINLNTDQLKAMLCTSAYTPNQDTHQYKSHVTGEVVGTGYTAGGQVLANQLVTYDAALNRLYLDADNPIWTNATITARHLVIYDNTPATDATKPLLAVVTFDIDRSSTSNEFRVNLDALGIGYLSVS